MILTHFSDELLNLEGKIPQSFSPGDQVTYIDDWKWQTTSENPGIIISIINDEVQVLWTLEPRFSHDRKIRFLVRDQLHNSLQGLIGGPIDHHRVSLVADRTLTHMQDMGLIDQFKIEYTHEQDNTLLLRATCLPVSLMSYFVVEIKIP